MIRINLLPLPERKPAITIDLYLFLLFLTVSLLICTISFFYVHKKISDLRAKIEDRKSKIAALDAIYKEYMSMERDKKEIQKRLAVVETIKKGRALPARILYDMTNLTKGTIWLKSLKKADTKLTVEGRAIENESIADFTEQLAKLPYVKNVELQKVEEVVEEGLAIKKFVLEAEISL